MRTHYQNPTAVKKELPAVKSVNGLGLKNQGSFRLGRGDLLASGSGTAMASVCAVGLLQIVQLVGGIWSIAAISLAGMMCWFLAGTLARLVHVVPSGASFLAFLSRGFGRRIAVIVVGPYLILMFFLVGIEALIIGQLLARLIPVPVSLTTLTFLVFTWAWSRSGLRWGYGAQSLSTWLLFLFLAGISVLVIFDTASQGKLNYSALPPFPPMLSFIAAVGQALFLFMGFELLTSHVEVAESGMIAWALKASVLMLVIFYSLVSMGISNLNPTSFGNEKIAIPQLAIADHVGGGWITVSMTIICLLASFSSFNGVLLGMSKLLYALATMGVIPRRLARLDPKTLSATAALNLLLAIAVGFTLIVYTTDLYKPVIFAAAVAASCLYSATVLVWECSGYRNPNRRANPVALGLAFLLAVLGLGVILDADEAKAYTLLLLSITYGSAFIAAGRLKIKP
jgi:amino acid transporter